MPHVQKVYVYLENLMDGIETNIGQKEINLVFGL
jgi:hypothetical protein